MNLFILALFGSALLMALGKLNVWYRRHQATLTAAGLRNDTALRDELNVW